MIAPKPVRLHWDSERGWIVDVPVAVSSAQLAQIAAWAVPRQIDRWRTLPAGDRKTELERAIKLLQAGKISQRVVGERGDGKGDILAFAARHEPSKLITVGAV